MTSRRRDSEHRQKIRESCNNCSAQKIRCGKQRPSCARCVAKSIECNYSYSQRTGRRAPAAIAPIALSTLNLPDDTSDAFTSQASMTNVTSEETGASPTPLATTAHPATPDSDCDPFIAIHSSSISDQPDIDVFETNNVDTLSFDTDISFKQTNVFHGFPSSMSFDFLWSPDSEVSYSTLEPGDITATAATTNPAHGLFTAYPQSIDWQTNQPNLAADSSTSTSPGHYHELITRQAQMRSHCRGQDCLALALQVVSDLHVSRESCSTVASDPMNCIPPSKEEARDVDQVLFLNRDAIKSVNKVLDCPCSSDPSVALACYLAASKIVAWYAAAIGFSGGQQMDGLETSLIMADRIIDRPIFMGRYCLDPEAQRSVRAKVVLTELREQIHPLLAKLPKHQVSSFGRPEHTSTSMSLSAATLPKDNDGQPCVLRNQIRRIIQEAGNINNTV